MYRTRFIPLPARLTFVTAPADGGGADPAPTGDTNQSGGDPAPTADDDPDPDGAEALGDPGKRALAAMKAERRAAQDEARRLREELEEIKAKAEGREKEFAAEQERRKVEAEALAKANDRIRKAEVRAAAAGKLADPADALLHLDLEQFEVGDDGEIDQAAVEAAISELVKSKPYLAAQGGTGPVFESPGSRRKGAPAGQLTKADLEGMTPEQISAARAEGRLNDLLGIKN